MSHVDLLSQTELFGKLTREELEAVARCVHESGAEAGSVLIREGQAGESMFLIRSGRVAVERTLDGRTVRLAELEPGGIFGEMSLLDDFPTSATVTTIEPSSFLCIGRLDLNVLLTWDTVLASKLWRSFTEVLCYRIRASNDRLLDRFGEEASRELIPSR